MNSNRRASRRIAWVGVTAAALTAAHVAVESAAGAEGADNALSIRESRATGVARFVTAADGGAIGVLL